MVVVVVVVVVCMCVVVVVADCNELVFILQDTSNTNYARWRFLKHKLLDCHLLFVPFFFVYFILFMLSSARFRI